MDLPFWFPKKNNWVWYAAFIVLFVLSLDFCNWNKAKPLIFGLPFWVVYFFGLTLSLSVVFYIFSRYQWGKDIE